MNDSHRMDDLEHEVKDIREEVNHNLTMLLGQSWKHGEELRVVKSQLERLDYRVTEAHKDIAEANQKLDKILALLEKTDTNGL